MRLVALVGSAYFVDPPPLALDKDTFRPAVIQEILAADPPFRCLARSQLAPHNAYFSSAVSRNDTTFYSQ